MIYVLLLLMYVSAHVSGHATVTCRVHVCNLSLFVALCVDVAGSCMYTCSCMCRCLMCVYRDSHAYIYIWRERDRERINCSYLTLQTGGRIMGPIQRSPHGFTATMTSSMRLTTTRPNPALHMATEAWSLITLTTLVPTSSKETSTSRAHKNTLQTLPVQSRNSLPRMR